MMEFLYARRWEKRNKIKFYWVMLLIYTNWEYKDILTDLIFGAFCFKIYIKRYLKQSST